MKKKNSISDTTLKLIKKKHLKPIPRWEFIVKNWTLWTGLILCLLLLVLGFALSIFGVVDNIIVPYLWLFIAIIFFVLSYLLFQKTKHAYHFPRWQVIIVMTALAFIFGTAFFKVGLARRLDSSLENRLPLYRDVVPMKLQTWSRPDQGYLSGTITKIIDDSNFEIIDFSGKTWHISGSNIIVKGRLTLKIGTEIKLVGSQSSKDTFTVSEIRPWGSGRN
jgi:hypothetical protein